MGNIQHVPGWALSGAVALAVVAGMVWQDSVHPCNDGRRYCSGLPQPTPFHRRWCGWPTWLLTVSSYAGLLFIASTLGSWWQSLLFVTLPGVWFCATRPTTVDAVSMGLAWGAALLFPTWPYAAVGVSCLSGFVHERGPVFAALYAWSPLLLVGIVGIGWWRKPWPKDADPYVGLSSLRETIRVHRKMHDWLDWRGYALSTRGLIPIATLVGVPLSAWAALALAHASRIVATDNSRIVLWGAPPMIAAMHDVPTWAVAVHALSFVRMF